MAKVGKTLFRICIWWVAITGFLTNLTILLIGVGGSAAGYGLGGVASSTILFAATGMVSSVVTVIYLVGHK